MSQTKSKIRRPGDPRGKASPLADRRVQVILALLVLVGGWFAFDAWRAASERAERRQQLLRDTRNELIQDQPDADRLGRFMADLNALPDADTSPEVLALRAEIELSRGRPERAYRLFGARAELPSAPAADQRLGSRILLARHEAFAGDRGLADTMLREAIRMSESAYSDSNSPRDLFVAWQAAMRLFDDATRDEIGGRLRAQHEDSRVTRLVQVWSGFQPQRSARDVDGLLEEFPSPPRELRVMQLLVELGRGDISGARERVERQVAQAPNVWALRWAKAIVLEALRKRDAGDPAASARWLEQRNEQYDWLLERAPVGYPMVEQWRQLRSQQ